MKSIYYILLSILCLQCKEATQAQALDEGTVVKIQEEAVQEILSFLAADDLEGRDIGSKGYEKAVVYAEKQFQSYGVPPYFKTYRDSFEVNGLQTYNVVGHVQGTDSTLAKEVILIGAHLDHIGTAAPEKGDQIANGANDNASGSTAVLLLAQYFAAHPPKRSMVFALFGAEEKGLLGSKHLAEVLREQKLNLYTMINFEMIGVPLQDKAYTAYLTGYEQSTMATVLNTYAQDNFIGFLPQAKAYHLFQRSDNYPFYQAFQVPCQTICTFDFTNYDYYHHVDDEVEKLDITFIASFLNTLVPVLTSVANTHTQEIKMKP